MVTHIRLQLIRNNVIPSIVSQITLIKGAGVVGTGDHFMVIFAPTGPLASAVRTLMDLTPGVLFTTTEGEHNV